MRVLVVLAAFVAVAFAAPDWNDGKPCGRSPYSDSGNQPLPPGANGRMIVGGVAARPHEFPWQASLRRKATNSHFCGGFIINDRWIMTASHCASGETPAILSIVVGDHTRNDNSNTVRRTLDVEKIIMHPNYNARTLVNDIALVKVTAASAIQFNSNIQPVCAPESSKTYAYERTVCSGWGTLSSGGTCCPQTLQYVSMNITTNAYCNNAYPRDQITNDMICATDNTGSNQRDSCQGDSGGPLIVQRADGSWEVVGIVSWGIGCASGYPGVYARVGYFESWVLGHLANS